MTEYVVTESFAVEYINAGGLRAMAIIGDLQRNTLEKKAEIEAKMSPFVGKSIIERLSQEQREMAAAMGEYIKQFPRVCKRLYRPNDDLYNVLMNMTVCAFDQFCDMIVEGEDIFAKEQKQ